MSLRRAHDAAPEIRADLKRRGAMVGVNDLVIAAHARALGVTPRRTILYVALAGKLAAMGLL